MTSIHIPVLWIPAIPAGMTCFYRLVYNDESSSLGTSVKNIGICKW